MHHKENHRRPMQSARRRRNNSTLQMIQALEAQSSEWRRNLTTPATSVSTASLTSNCHASDAVSSNLVTSEDIDCCDDDIFVSVTPIAPDCSLESDLLAIKNDEPFEIAIVTPEPTPQSGGRRRRRPIPETPIAYQEGDLVSQIEATAMEVEAPVETRHVKKIEFAQYMDEFKHRHKKGTSPRSTPVKKVTSGCGSPKNVLDFLSAETTRISDPLSILLNKFPVDTSGSHDIPGLRRVSNDSFASVSSDSLSSGDTSSLASTSPRATRNEVWTISYQRHEAMTNSQ